MNKIAAILMVSAAALFAEDVAVFPPEGVNTDRSYIEAFGMVLAQKYAKVSGLKVMSPLKAAKSAPIDSNHVQAAAKLGVSEYLEIEAVGLYLSKKEAKELIHDSSGGTNVYVNVDNSNSGGGSDDQEKLDNHKTIVTVSRMDKNGGEIYKVEMTLVTYGDIEEASDRIAEALWRKVPIEQTRTMTNITRREGMGSNQMFSLKRKGIKIGGIYPYGWNSTTLSSIVTIGFSMRFDAEKYFLEIGGGGKIPTAMYTTSARSYGGGYLDVGGNYYLKPGNVAWYIGGGVSPGIYFATSSDASPGVSFALAPYLQTGIMLPRMSKTAFYVEVRVAQHIMPVTTTYQSDSTTMYGSTTVSGTQVLRPLEAGINFGICW
jgi:hypothetical protein